MKIASLHEEILSYLNGRSLSKKFEKQKRLFEGNPFHPSLQTELLEPKRMKFWSFRIDRKYRAIFIFLEADTVEIIDINNHYK